MAESFGDVGRALSWCYIALRQAERVPESFAAYETARAAGREHSQLEFLYWGDAHFLISATYHMTEALKGLSSGPKLPKRLREQIARMRHLLEHWGDEEERKRVWRTLAKMHGQNASPWVAVRDDTDLLIGPDFFSLRELQQALASVRDELLPQYTEEPEERIGTEERIGMVEMLELVDGLIQQYAKDPAPAPAHKLLELWIRR